MNLSIEFKRTSSSSWRRAFLLTVILPLFFRLLPTAQGILPPPPPDGYPGGNTAEGTDALFKLINGGDNTAVGFETLHENTKGDFNTAVGSLAIFANTLSSRNTATGYQALTKVPTGIHNTANGYRALAELRRDSQNAAMGFQALSQLTGGGSNIAIGRRAGVSLTMGRGNIYIGNDGVAAESFTIRIGNPQHRKTFVTGIRGARVTGAPVSIETDGKLGTTPSSQRFKDQIKPMGNASDPIFALEPVTFRYKKEVDPENAPQFGLIAEDVEKVDPQLVVRDKDGKPFSVRYDQVNAMLLNEFLKAQRELEQEEATIAQQQRQIEALTLGLQKVSAQLQVSKPARQVVNNP
jgi:trimeric autotransporter adhesin